MAERGVSPLPREARPYQGRRAGLVTRMAAAALDGVVVSLLLLIGYAAVAVFLACVALVASTFPAIRAVRVDPMLALRSE